MTLMRFNPVRKLDRLADQALVGARTARTLPLEALRRGEGQQSLQTDSAQRESVHG
jgi:hypothetical protein